ncbi:hypothetical protein BDR26DRAFT_665523 [Obelidium mucronatum]|nr:hypothetical protein BDR26DRAFT_665523 [Obelidium mucronatum]
MDSDAQPFPWPLRNNCKTSSLATVAAYLTRLEALDPKLKLSALPRGYKLLEQQRRDSLHTDRYLYGHPSGHQFRSAIEFLPHCQFLLSGRTTQCICKLCVPKKLRKTLAPKTNGKKQYGKGNNSNLSDLSIKNYLQKSKTNLTRKRIQWRKENAMKTLDLDSNDGSMLTDLDSQQDLESTSTTSSALTSLDASDLESVSTRDDDISILTEIDQLVGWDSDVSEALEFVALDFSRLRKQQQQWKSQQPAEKLSNQSRGYDTDVSELTDLEEQIGWESDTTSALSDCDGDKFSCWNQNNHLTAAGKQIILQSVSLAYSLVSDETSTCRECGNRIQGVFIKVDEIPFHWFVIFLGPL